MNKYILLLLFISLSLTSFAQKGDKIFVERSSRSYIDNTTGMEVVYIKNPVFRHANSIMTCDSAVLYVALNYFEAFKNVHINQADTVNIYSQRLTYDGNTKKAHLSENVRLLDGQSVLTTNILDYDMVAKIGEYSTGGKIVNKDVNIVSKNGYYFANSRDAYFRYNVLVVTKDNKIKSDTLRYNTLTNWAYFYGPTNIEGKDDNLYTELGQYNTKYQEAAFGKKNLYTQGSKSLTGDSLYYNGIKGYGRAVKNIIFKDTADKMLLRGQLGEYYKADESAVVTRNAYFGMGTNDTLRVDDKILLDTIWITGDTLKTKRVLQSSLIQIPRPVLANLEAKSKSSPPVAPVNTNKLPAKTDSLAIKKNTVAKAVDSVKKNEVLLPVKPAKDKLVAVADKNTKKIPPDIGGKNSKLARTADSIEKPLDTLKSRIISAYHNVKVFKNNVQAKADSLFFSDADSTLRWFKNPILWAEGSQQTGDTIYAHLKNKKLESFQILRNGFIVNAETDSTKFNQVKGKTITGFMNDGALKNVFVDGNAESVYFDKDSKGVLTHLNQSVSGSILIVFKDKAMSDIIARQKPEIARTPIEEMTGEKLLTGFIWKPELRPTSKFDIIGKPAVAPVKKKVTPVVKKAAPVKKPIVVKKVVKK